MTQPSIYLDTSPPVAAIVLNKPARRNALDLEMWQTLPHLLDQIEQDEEIRVGIVRGVDARAFASGADIKEFGKIHGDPETSHDYNETVRRAARKLSRFPKPMIAMIQGPCVGGGCGIALACDLRIADTSARFGVPPAKLGLIYSLEDTKLLIDAVGASRAREMLFTGRLVEADEALAIGLIDRLIAAETIEAETMALAQEIVAASPFSVRHSKRIVRMILDGASEDTLETRAVFDAAFQGADYREGTRAFIEKRKPDFRDS